MTNVTLRQLRSFCALARLGHFGHAADVCAISQPALSQQMRELEAQLGAALIDRSGRRIALTPLGVEVAARAAEIVAAVDALGTLARAAAAQVTLRLGLIPTVAPYLLPALLARVGAEAPHLGLRPHEAKTARLVEGLREGWLDAALVALPVAEAAGLAEAPLWTEAFRLARPLAEAGAPVPPAAALEARGLLMLEQGHCFRDQALAWCGGGGSGGGSGGGQRIEGSALATLVQMVAAGLGVTLIPDIAVATERAAARIDVAPLPDPAPTRTLGLVWRRGSPLAPHLEGLAALIREVVDVQDG